MKYALDFTDKPTARNFFFSPEQFTCFFGGIRNGKTFTACAKLILKGLVFPGSRALIGRKEYTELRDSTMQVFFDEVLPRFNNGKFEGGIIKDWNKTDKILTLINGSKFLFRCLEEFTKIKGTEFSDIYVDEGEEVPEETINWLESRLSWWSVPRINVFIKNWTQYQVNNFGKAFKPKASMIVTGNPHPGWAKKRYKQDTTGTYKLFEASTEENESNLPKGYIEGLRQRMPLSWIKRFVDGDWDVFGGQVFEEFDERIHYIDPFPVPGHWQRIIGLDHGWTNPTAVEWAAIDEEGNWFFYDEHYKAKLFPHEHAAIIKQKCEGQKVPAWQDGIIVHMDSATKQTHAGNIPVIEQYLEYGIYGKAVDNRDVVGMVLKMQQLIHVDPRHLHPITRNPSAPRFYVFKGRCPALVEEIRTLEYEEISPGQEKNFSEKPKKYKDHAVNAAMYMIKNNLQASDALQREDTPDEYRMRKLKGIAKNAFGFNEKQLVTPDLPEMDYSEDENEA